MGPGPGAHVWCPLCNYVSSYICIYVSSYISMFSKVSHFGSNLFHVVGHIFKYYDICPNLAQICFTFWDACSKYYQICPPVARFCFAFLHISQHICVFIKYVQILLHISHILMDYGTVCVWKNKVHLRYQISLIFMNTSF